MSGYKLTYFNVMGLGEPIRFLLSYGGVEFEDIRLEHTSEEWKALKPSTPWGQMPLLEFDGNVYSQTLPICRYLAKKFDLIGKTDIDALQIDAVANALHDFRKQVALYYRESDPVLRAQRKVNVLTNVVPFYVEKLEKLASENGCYFHNGQLSYADLFFVAISNSISTACECDITEDRPSLKALTEKVLALPKIKQWVEKRPKLSF